MVPAEFNTAGEQTAYKTGFADGFAAATQAEQRSVRRQRARRDVVALFIATQVVESFVAARLLRLSSRESAVSGIKHRDKLTVAMGTGAGAAIGGLIGGKKGAAIGALSGAGGSALWTYKLRNRNRNY